MDNELWRWVWVVTAMVMGLGEIFTAGFFLLPFGIGAALAAIAAWLDLHGAVQWLLFFGGTGVSMLVLRRFMGQQDKPDDLPVGANRYIGMSGRVVQKIDLVANTGQVRVESDEWRAIAETGAIEEGSLVRITALRGTKLLVELEEPPPPDYVSIMNAGQTSHSPAVASPADADVGHPIAEATEAAEAAENAESGNDSADEPAQTTTPRSD